MHWRSLFSSVNILYHFIISFHEELKAESAGGGGRVKTSVSHHVSLAQMPWSCHFLAIPNQAQTNTITHSPGSGLIFFFPILHKYIFPLSSRRKFPNKLKIKKLRYIWNLTNIFKHLPPTWPLSATSIVLFLYLLYPSLIVVFLSSSVGREGDSAPDCYVHNVGEEGRIHTGGTQVKYQLYQCLYTYTR